MKEIKVSEVMELASEYARRELITSPLHLCFPSNPTCDTFRREFENNGQVRVYCLRNGHPVRGHERMILNDEIVSVAAHPEFLENDVMPESLQNNKDQYDCILWYKYVGQFELLDVQYAESVQKIIGLPLIFVTNEYEYSRKSDGAQYVTDHFENIMIKE